MNNNTFIIAFGLNPEDYENIESEPIAFDDGFIYELFEKTDKRKCPFCSNDNSRINKRYWKKVRSLSSITARNEINVLRVQFYCQKCNKTFTNKLKGIDDKKKITNQVEKEIIAELTNACTFSDVARRHNLTTARVIQIFDKAYDNVPRKYFPKILCIDEIRFSGTYDSKYVCVLYDYESKDIIDIIRSRQKAYLHEYFGNISQRERDNVQVFISDMYEGYRSICKHYFKNAFHIVDSFHFVTQLTRAVNQLRVKVMNGYNFKGDRDYCFMKSHWKLFLCRYEKIPNKFYCHKQDRIERHFDKMVIECVTLDERLHEAYNVLQDIYHFYYYSNYSEAFDFLVHIINRLRSVNEKQYLDKVADTYSRWIIEISNAYYCSNDKHFHYTNAIAEGLNNQLKTIIKNGYGYSNFERYRKKVLLQLTWFKKKK